MSVPLGNADFLNVTNFPVIFFFLAVQINMEKAQMAWSKVGFFFFK